MKKILIPLFLCLALLFSACGRREAPAPVNPALCAQLDRLRDGVQPGTAGSSLKAAGVAADLLDWAADPIPQENLDATVREWLAAQSAEARSLLPQQLDSLRDTLEALVLDYEGSAGLLEDAGLTGRGPWEDDARQRVLTLFEALEASQ